jgi:hypothetical protein
MGKIKQLLKKWEVSMRCLRNYGFALTLVFLSAAVSDAAQITILARNLNNQPITGVTLRVKVFDATNRNNPAEDAEQQQIFRNTNGTLIVNVNNIVNVKLVIDDNGAGVLDTATLNGLINIHQQIAIAMPETVPPLPIICQPLDCIPCCPRCCRHRGCFRR